MKKAELLAPAGNYDALRGAIKAGADAVYLGGELYGARAYADNFTQDEICTGIHLAHAFDRKVYLTVNTLIKEKELDGLYNFLLPFYECGLDGVIIQDLGALRFIKRHFPELSLHASTQMTITGSDGAAFIKNEGISRIVPARELSLEEIKKIKKDTDLEIETFIHGAMCYCYSGQCLLSSILGGRSGNRGRCAQPCRLPYKIDPQITDTKKEKALYPLSMRDMCTISMLPELIEAGIDSFKIEGRMKKPAYAAGVTAIYRKYMDLYYKNKENFHVEKEDMDILNSLYIRSEVSDGYYKRHNDREMISLYSPAYSATDEKLLASIQKNYVEAELCCKVNARACFQAGSASCLTLSSGEVSVTCMGAYVQKALKQPLSKEKITDQIKKCGNSIVKIVETDIKMDDAIFMPVSAINELRRNAVEAFEKELIRRNGLSDKEQRIAKPYLKNTMPVHTCLKNGREPSGFHVSVRTKEQLWAALKEKTERIYLDYSLLKEDICRELKKYKETMPYPVGLYLAVPYIVRENNRHHLKAIKNAFAEDNLFEGVLIRNLESFYFLVKQNFQGKMILDANLYLWNHESVNFWRGQASEFYLPVECNLHEWKEILKDCDQRGLKASAVVYGRLPMMVTANCLNKTRGICNKTSQMVMIRDRYEKQFPVYADCQSCYNIIYNSVPLSLHKLFEDTRWMEGNFRLDFTLENAEEVSQVIRYFKGLFQNDKAPFYKEYTTGHLKRGVE